MIGLFRKVAVYRRRAVKGLMAGTAPSSVLILIGCASDRSRRDYRIGVSFEDETSCGHYRSLQIFDDGRIKYAISRLPQYSRALQISRDDVKQLVRLIKTFPLELSNFADHTVVNRGNAAGIRLLKDELTRLANIDWEDLSAQDQSCARSSHNLPSGFISLPDDE